MDRLRSGFHRKSSTKNSPSRPTIITDGPQSSGKTTPEPGASQPLQVPQMPNKKSSPLRSLRELGRSHKRARSPQALSPTSAISRDSPTDRPMTSPQPSRKDSQLSSVTTWQDTARETDEQLGASTGQLPRIPSFLDLNQQQIDSKFQELVWMERDRLAQSVTNPSPDFQWARVNGDHLKKLDRYINIQPWENNRVRLKIPAGKVDYINASPITLASLAPHTQSHAPNGDHKKGDTILGLSELAGGAAPDRYIAMQGPKNKTTSHVWRMVVEQLDSPGVIVMLTETHEANMEKCFPYFPRSTEEKPLQVNPKDEFGDGFRATVRCEAIEETEAGDAIELRKLVVRVFKGTRKPTSVNGRISGEGPPTPENAVDENGDVKMFSPKKTSAGDELPDDGADNDADSVTVEFNRRSSDQADATASESTSSEATEEDYEERVVWHFLYKKWPDFGVPAFEDLDSFFTLMRLSRQKNANPSNPRIVHCSAGVGRSGTFIALEHLMREMDAGVLDNWDSHPHFRHGNDKDVENDASSMDGHNGHVEKTEIDGAGSSLKMDVEEDKNALPLAEGNDLIFHTVNRLREQRRHMVQADTQYSFLYQVVRKLWEDRHGISVTSTVSDTAPQLPDITYSSSNGEPAAKRLEFDPFVEKE